MLTRRSVLLLLPSAETRRVLCSFLFSPPCGSQLSQDRGVSLFFSSGSRKFHLDDRSRNG